MIKTLLLTISCVVGSGAGALQKNAPVFNHYAIEQTETTNTTKLDITNEQLNNETFNSPVVHKAGRNNQSKLISNRCYTYQSTVRSQSNWQNGQENTATYKIVQITKIIPYLEFAGSTVKTYISIPTEFNYDVNLGSNDLFTEIDIVQYTSTDGRWNNILEQNQYGAWPYNPITQQFGNERFQWETAHSAMQIVNNTIDNYYNDYDQDCYIQKENYIDTYAFRSYQEYTMPITTQPVFFATEITIEANPIYEIQNWEGQPTIDTELTLNKANPTPIPPSPDEPSTYEVVPIYDLMFDILTMPFTFISKAFDLTIFPNTPYSVNLTQLFLALFAALVFIFIIKKFIKK